MMNNIRMWNNDNLINIEYNVLPKLTQTQRKKQRSFCTQNMNTTCIYCGGKYKKTFYSVDIDDTLQPCCQLCHIVTHFIPKYTKMIVIYKSSLTQLDIIRKTVEYILSHKQVPEVQNIDSNATQIKIKLISFFHHLNDATYKNYRIFYTSNIAISNILFSFMTGKTKNNNESEEPEEYEDDENFLISKNSQYQSLDIIIPTMERINKWNQKFLQNK